MSSLDKTLDADLQVSVEQKSGVGMVTLKGDLADAKLQATCADIAGVPFPDVRKANSAGETGLMWMAPDEVLLVMPHDAVAGAVTKLNDALAGSHFLALDMSDARAVFALKGAAVREVLARLTPADLHPDTLPAGEFRRTKIGQVPGAFWLTADDAAMVVCFRSIADYMHGLLSNSAKAGPVGHFPG